MSSGAFIRSFYELNSGEVASIRVQPETLALSLGGGANAAATGPADVPGSAKVSGGARSIGINARKVSIVFTGTPPEGYKADSPISLPWLIPNTWEALSPGATGTYLGAAVELIGKSPERIR